MYLLAISDSPEVYISIPGLIHGVVLTSTVDVRPLRACRIAVNGSFMCHTECKWALQILLGPSIYASASKALGQWPQTAGFRYYCSNSGFLTNPCCNLRLHPLPQDHWRSNNISFVWSSKSHVTMASPSDSRKITEIVYKYVVCFVVYKVRIPHSCHSFVIGGCAIYAEDDQPQESPWHHFSKGEKGLFYQEA